MRHSQLDTKKRAPRTHHIAIWCSRTLARAVGARIYVPLAVRTRRCSTSCPGQRSRTRTWVLASNSRRALADPGVPCDRRTRRRPVFVLAPLLALGTGAPPPRPSAAPSAAPSHRALLRSEHLLRNPSKGPRVQRLPLPTHGHLEDVIRCLCQVVRLALVRLHVEQGGPDHLVPACVASTCTVRTTRAHRVGESARV